MHWRPGAKAMVVKMLSMVSKKIVEVEGLAPKLKKSATPSAKFVKGFDIKKNKLIELQRSMQQLASANKALGKFKKHCPGVLHHGLMLQAM